ncbi:hypothetical protein ANN_22360 [Periplaneta americana]|uniref:Uncharacterized protein n=1 Tax=Periplaneta americana TaxID=6978 RepID=A0ABQ8S841_PERAM|nr:hypothetical protein ANN_22360 [Periplaneta americana]
MDDTFVIWNLIHLNSHHAQIQFTMETENDGQLPFLDVLTEAMTKTLFNWAKRVSDPQHLDQEIGHLMSTLEASGYSAREITRALKPRKHTPPSLSQGCTKRDMMFLSYYKHVTDCISKSAVAEHEFQERDHIIRFEDTDILSGTPHLHARLHREAIEICKHKNNFNRKEEGLKVNQAWYLALRNTSIKPFIQQPNTTVVNQNTSTTGVDRGDNGEPRSIGTLNIVSFASSPSPEPRTSPGQSSFQNNNTGSSSSKPFFQTYEKPPRFQRLHQEAVTPPSAKTPVPTVPTVSTESTVPTVSPVPVSNSVPLRTPESSPSVPLPQYPMATSRAQDRLLQAVTGADKAAKKKNLTINLNGTEPLDRGDIPNTGNTNVGGRTIISPLTPLHARLNAAVRKPLQVQVMSPLEEQLAATTLEDGVDYIKKLEEFTKSKGMSTPLFKAMPRMSGEGTFYSCFVKAMSGMSDDDDDDEGEGETLVPARSLLLLNSTKGAARLNVPIRRTNHYQQ